MPDIQFSVPAASVILPAMLIGILLTVTALQRHDRLTLARLVTVFVTAGYLAAVAVVTLFPMRVTLWYRPHRSDWWGQINLIPLVTADAPGFILNMLMTVPLGLLAPVVLRVRSVGAAALVGLTVSATIELLQLVGDITYRAGRTVDVNDLIANTLGAVLGFLVLRVLTRIPVVAAGLDRLSLPTDARTPVLV